MIRQPATSSRLSLHWPAIMNLLCHQFLVNPDPIAPHCSRASLTLVVVYLTAKNNCLQHSHNPSYPSVHPVQTYRSSQWESLLSPFLFCHNLRILKVSHCPERARLTVRAARKDARYSQNFSQGLQSIFQFHTIGIHFLKEKMRVIFETKKEGVWGHHEFCQIIFIPFPMALPLLYCSPSPQLPRDPHFVRFYVQVDMSLGLSKYLTNEGRTIQDNLEAAYQIPESTNWDPQQA